MWSFFIGTDSYALKIKREDFVRTSEEINVVDMMKIFILSVIAYLQ